MSVTLKALCLKGIASCVAVVNVLRRVEGDGSHHHRNMTSKCAISTLIFESCATEVGGSFSPLFTIGRGNAQGCKQSRITGCVDLPKRGALGRLVVFPNAEERKQCSCTILQEGYPRLNTPNYHSLHCDTPGEFRGGCEYPLLSFIILIYMSPTNIQIQAPLR